MRGLEFTDVCTQIYPLLGLTESNFQAEVHNEHWSKHHSWEPQTHRGEAVIFPMSKLLDICWSEALMLNDFLHICKVDKFKIYSEIKLRWKHAMGGSYI